MAAVLLPPLSSPFPFTAAACLLFDIYSALLLINPYKQSQDKALLERVKLLLSENDRERSQDLSCFSNSSIGFRPLQSKSTNKSIFQVVVVMTWFYSQ